MKTTPTPLESFKLWSIMDATYRSVFKAREHELLSDGILIMQVRVLAVIERASDEATPANLARLLWRKPHTISQMLSRMEKAGLVTKGPDPTHRNRVIVKITPKGHETYALARERRTFNRIISGLTARKREQLMNLLNQVWKNAQQELGDEDRDIHPWDTIDWVLRGPPYAEASLGDGDDGAGPPETFGRARPKTKRG